MSSAPIIDAGWSGWWRPSRKTAWSRVAAADTYSDCWGATLDALAHIHGGESLVVRMNTDPNLGSNRPYRRRGGATTVRED